jgi:hypothetical protein
VLRALRTAAWRLWLVLLLPEADEAGCGAVGVLLQAHTRALWIRKYKSAFAERELCVQATVLRSEHISTAISQRMLSHLQQTGVSM